MHTIPASSLRHDDYIVLPDSSKPHFVRGIYPAKNGLALEISDHDPSRPGASKMIFVRRDELVTVAA